MAEPDLRAIVDSARDRVTGFCQRLVRAQSFTGEEKPTADLVLAEMQALGYASVERDEAGNILGCIPGGPGQSVMLHAHMDVVDPGDVSRWRHPPFGGEIAEGCIWGRGSSDDKGCLAAQVYAAGLIREEGLRPAGDVYVAAAVCEETVGLGTKFMMEYFRPGLAVIGEPSGNTLRRGHRGRFEFIVTMYGRSAHASAPERGLNPHYSMSRFLLALRQAPLVEEPVFGGTSVSPTLYYTDQTGSNVIPAEVTVHLDWRNAPGETVKQAQALVERLVNESLDPGIEATVRIRDRDVRTYTGMEETVHLAMGSFYREADDPLVMRAHHILEGALARPVEVSVWGFCTDGGSVSAAGVPCVGFGPGNEAMAHVLDERIEIEELIEATVGYMALALQLGG